MKHVLSSGTRPPRQVFDAGLLQRELESKFRLSRDPGERAVLADALVPEYLSTFDAESASAVLAATADVDDPAVRARLNALRAIVAAIQGEDPSTLAARSLGEAELLPAPVRALVHQRIGLAFMNARDAVRTHEHELRALALCEELGLRRLAARAASVLYALLYHLTGDLQAARYFAELATLEATTCSDAPMRRRYLIAQFDLAAVFGEWDRARSLRELLRRETDPELAAAIAVAVGDALLHGATGDFAAMHGAVSPVLRVLANTADLALLRGICSLALAGLGKDSEARSEARRALGLSRVQGAGEMAYLLIRRRLGAVLAAYTSMLVGDSYHGSRALDTRAQWPGAIGYLASVFLTQTRGGALDSDDRTIRSVRGYAIVADTVKNARAKRLHAIPHSLRSLTHTELVVIRAIADGKSAVEIARDRGVTPTAVKRRLACAYRKLGVRGRAEAIALVARASVAV